MTDDEAIELALSMSTFQRKVLIQFSREEGWGYRFVAAKVGATYTAIQAVGRFLTSRKLARITLLRVGSEYAGSGLVLNERGHHVSQAAKIIEKKLSHA